MARTNWAAIAHGLASRLVYQAEACEHDGTGGEACCLDWLAYRRFVDAGGTDFARSFRQVEGRSVSMWDVVGSAGDRAFSESHDVDEHQVGGTP